MKIKQIVNNSAFVVLLLVACVASIIASSAPALAGPGSIQVKCVNGKKVTVTKDMRDDKTVLDNKDSVYACRKNGGYKVVDETIDCKDDTNQNVYKSAAGPKDKLTDADRKAACKDHGGIKVDTEDPESTDPIAGNDCGGVETAIIKCSQNNSGDIENNGVWGLLMLVLNILTAGVGIVAVGGIVYGAVLYTTAEDKADQVKKATDIITNVVIGLIAFALMWALLNFIVPGGAFS